MLNKIKVFLIPTSFVFLLVMPASTSYKLKDFGFGSGGTAGSTSSNYSIEGITGEVSGGKETGASYNFGPGLIFANQANVPGAPTFDNPSNYYNKLRIILNASNNPTDTKYAIAISSDNFTTTNYVQSDNTVGSVLGAEDYQTYTGWGGASGIHIIGLAPGIAYKTKAKAIQGKFTETGYGPEASTSTANPTLTFDIDVSATDSETNPPFSIDFGSLTTNTVNDSPQKIWIDLSTNGESGGKVYVNGQNAGLQSQVASYLINSVSGNLNALSQGFGAQGSSATQTSGGPFSIATLYNQTGNTVGITDQSIREIFSSSNPISGGRGSFVLKAKPSAITPSASDYRETLTVIASGSY